MASPVVVVPYDPAWPETFRALRTVVVAALGDLPAAIEHVGSTAVPGLAAKPIVDLDVVVSTPADVPAAIARLAAAGYVHEGDLGIAGREAFRAPAGTPPHHLYLVVAGNRAHRDHVLLRDYLRAHPDAVRAYAALKLSAAERCRDDRDAYQAARRGFVEALIRVAEGETP